MAEIGKKNNDKEQYHRQVTDNTPVMAWITDVAAKCVYLNKPWYDFSGQTEKEALGFGWLKVVHPDDAKTSADIFLKANNKHVAFNLEYRLRRKDGQYRWHIDSGLPKFDDQGNFAGYVGSVIDIHERKQAEEALQQQLQITKAITDIATACLFMIDDSGLVTFMNPSAQRVTGYSQNDALGQPMHSLVHHSHPDGTPYPDKDCPLVNTYKFGKPNPLHEDIFFRKDGTPFDALIIGTPIPGAEGMQGTVVEFRDITEEKRAQNELRELIKITEQRNALVKINNTKDEFIGMASHQLRTPATAVKQYIGLLMNNFAGPLTPEQNQYLKIAYDSNERELNIISDLLKTAQISADNYDINKEALDVAKIINECITDLQITFEQKKQKVIFEKPSAAIRTLLDRSEVKLALINLLENASKYSYIGTEIFVVLKRKEKHVEISVSDKGVGISKENQQRIFEKFTRVDNELSDTVTGTGLGLFWVKRIIEIHKGSIKIESKLGKGSTFIVRLPR